MAVTHLLLAAAICRLLVLPPPKFAPDKLSAAEEEGAKCSENIDMFISDRLKKKGGGGT